VWLFTTTHQRAIAHRRIIHFVAEFVSNRQLEAFALDDPSHGVAPPPEYAIVPLTTRFTN
jgi:hypothetical protein